MERGVAIDIAFMKVHKLIQDMRATLNLSFIRGIEPTQNKSYQGHTNVSPLPSFFSFFHQPSLDPRTKPQDYLSCPLASALLQGTATDRILLTRCRIQEHMCDILSGNSARRKRNPSCAGNKLGRSGMCRGNAASSQHIILDSNAQTHQTVYKVSEATLRPTSSTLDVLQEPSIDRAIQ